MNLRPSLLLLPLLLPPALLPAQTLPAQTQTQSAAPVRELHAHPDWPHARPEDVDSPQAVVKAFFSAISAPKGGTLDHTRLRSLFVPDGRIEIPIPAEGDRPADVIFLSPDAYADRSDASTRTAGFFDHTLAQQVRQYGIMAHVYAAYESRNNLADPKPFVRGIKSFELLNSAGRWYLVQVSWVRETPDNPIPDQYLHDSPR